jgi:hypothetical protein
VRNLKSTALFFAFILCLSSMLQAATNKYGVADVRKVTFSAATRVGDVLLPQGNYEVRHVMEAENHMMVFKQLDTNKPAEARVKCNLVQLKEKAEANQVIYESNGANERVLRTLRFRGDLAEHVF